MNEPARDRTTIRILVVDDVPEVLAFLRSALPSPDFEVTTATGEDAPAIATAGTSGSTPWSPTSGCP